MPRLSRSSWSVVVGVLFTVVTTLGFPKDIISDTLLNLFRVFAYTTLVMASMAWLLVHIPYLARIRVRERKTYEYNFSLGRSGCRLD